MRSRVVDLLKAMGVDASDDSAVLDLAAVGATKLLWRDSPLEDWHSQGWRDIRDADMLRGNVATTRVVRRALGQHLDDLAELGRIVARPERKLPDGRSVAELAVTEADMRDLRRHVNRAAARWTALAEQHEPAGVRAMLACVQGYQRDLWWLTPWWPNHVDEFIQRIEDTSRRPDWVPENVIDALAASAEELRAVLLDGPDKLSRTAAQRCVAAGLGHGDGHPLRHVPSRPYRLVTALLDPDAPRMLQRDLLRGAL